MYFLPVFAKDNDQPSIVVTPDTNNTKSIKNVGNKITGVIKVVGTIVSVGMIIVLGIKYMMGSAEERAEYKKTLFPYFIGAVLIFGASRIAVVIYTWASQVGK